MTYKWRKMAEVYKAFNQEGDFSKEAAEAMYLYESRGGELPGWDNGYYTGKHLMDVTVKMWKDDLNGKLDDFPLLTKKELYEDEKFPHWWLDKVL